MKMNKSLILRMARKRLGMPQASKGDLLYAICDRLQCAPPPSWDRRYRFIQKWCEDTPLPVTAKAKRDAPMFVRPKVALSPFSLPVPRESKRDRKIRERAEAFAQTDAFLLSYEWRRLRMVVIRKRGARCECCGATPADGIRINVDHVKPRKTYPELALDESNLQVLCAECNHGKGNWDDTDWRAENRYETHAPMWGKPGTVN